MSTVNVNPTSNTITIIDNGTQIVTVNTQGPQGPAGIAGASGSQGPSGSIPTGTVSGSSQITELGFVTSSATASFVTNDQTGSFAITGSSVIFNDVTASNISASGYISASSFIGDGSQLTGVTSFPFTGSAKITGSLIVTGSSTLSGSVILNDITYPTTDGDNGDIIYTNGAGVLTFDKTKVFAPVKNVAGGTLYKGTPVHASSSVGNANEVIAASASVASTMPATFVLAQDLADQEEGLGIVTGFINGVNTTGFNEGDIVYVGADGGYTNVKPSGSNLIQNLGIVTKVAVNGSGYIYGAGRSNDTPNLLHNQIFFGSGSNQQYQIHISGALDSTVINNITASGNISASGDLEINNRILVSSSLSSAGSTSGDIVKIGNVTTVAGLMYALTGSAGGWTLASSGSGQLATSSLAIALGTNSTTNGMLLRGMVNVGHDPGGVSGGAIYLADGGSASYASSTTTNHVVRVIGHNYENNVIYFNPSNDWIVRS